MKKGNRLHGLKTKALGLALVFSMALSFCAPLQVEAKKIKTLTLKRENFVSNVEYIDSVATTVKAGTYKIKIKTKSGSSYCPAYIKFVAPETKTYSITLSELKCNNNKFTCGTATLKSPDSVMQYASTRYDAVVNGKKNHALFVHSKKYPLGTYAPKRTANIHLNEGEVLYLNFGFAATRPTKYVTAKIKIK